MLFQKSSDFIFSLSLALYVVFASHAGAAEPAGKKMLQPTALSTATSESSELSLIVDFANILQIEGEMSAIAVGNPEIADASMADQSTVILTGRAVGVTNFIAINDTGEVLVDVMLRVTSQKPGVVTVRRGMQLQSYTCTSSHCEGSTQEPVIQIDAAPVPEAAS
jgi:Flp pilus assembly secretin CpaC